MTTDKDTRSAQTKRFHAMIDGWLKADPEKLEKARERSREHRKRQRDAKEHKPMTNTMPPLEVGRNAEE